MSLNVLLLLEEYFEVGSRTRVPLCCLWKMMNTCLGKRIPSFFFFTFCHTMFSLFGTCPRVQRFRSGVDPFLRVFGDGGLVDVASVAMWEACPCVTHNLCLPEQRSH